MKNILVTGSNGQLGIEIKKLSLSCPDFNFLFTDIDELDLSKPGAIESFFKLNKIDVCINCAAYNAVDKAMDEPALAFLLNQEVVETLAKTCSDYKALLIHFSTDYVFDGSKNLPYLETDPAVPQTIYGLSKLNGEQAALNNTDRALVIRTSWLYSAHGHNFVKTILRLFSEKEQIEVVDDQLGTPTFAGDLAKAVLEIIAQVEEKSVRDVYHFSNEGVASWYDFAVAIKELSNAQCKIRPIDSSRFPSKAKRPNYSVLNKTKIKTGFGIEIPYWRDSLAKVICELEKTKSTKP